MTFPLPPLNFNNSSAADPYTSLEGQSGGTGPFIVGGSGRLAANTGPDNLNSAAAAALNQVDPTSLAMIAASVFLLLMLMRGRK